MRRPRAVVELTSCVARTLSDASASSKRRSGGVGQPSGHESVREGAVQYARSRTLPSASDSLRAARSCWARTCCSRCALRRSSDAPSSWRETRVVCHIAGGGDGGIDGGGADGGGNGGGGLGGGGLGGGGDGIGLVGGGGDGGGGNGGC
eukprot:2322069-Prymnesium_polylepis.1